MSGKERFLVLLAILYRPTLETPIASAKSLDVKISPSVIEVGITKHLMVNCSFSFGHPVSMSSLISLIIYHNQSTASSQTPLELASINVFNNDHVEFLAQVNATGTGSIGQSSDSFICLQWDYPKQSQTGDYRCVARGIDLYGHPMMTAASGSVSQDAPDLDSVMNKIREIDSHLEDIDTKLDTFILDTETKLNISNQEYADKFKNLDDFDATIAGKLENVNTLVANIGSRLDSFNEDSAKKFKTLDAFYAQITSRLEEMIKAMFSISSEFKGSHYILSYHLEQDVNVAEAICKICGGYLAEIEDSAELAFVKSFTLPAGHVYVLIGITDEASEGHYKFRFSGRTVTYLPWDKNGGEPDGGRSQNCITLDKYRRLFTDTACHGYKYRFLCEIPNKN